jgi:RHS repeat-associated protein
MRKASQQWSSTSRTVYAFGLEEHLYSGSGVNQGNTYYYHLKGMLIGESDGTNINMFLTDALGSVLETISATANSATVQGNQVYSPYGSSRYQQGSMGTAKGFTGQYNDSVTGLDYYGARYYDPVVGRFLSADTAEGNGVGMDPYAYVDGNPETYSDPTGQVVGDSAELEARIQPVGNSGQDGGPNIIQLLIYLLFGGAYVAHGVQTLHGSTQTQSDQATRSPLSDVIVTHGNETYTYNPQTGAITIETTFPDGRKVWQGMLPGDTGYEQALHAFDIQLPGAVNSAAWAAARKQSGGSNPPGGGNGGCSFTSTTQVSTDHGKQAIGTLHVGDKVLAYNPKTHQMELEPILHVWKHTDHDLIDLTIATTAKGQHGEPATRTSEVVHTTSEHPFFTTEQGFVAAGKLKLGMHVLRADGNVGVVTGWKVVPGTEVMYNLEVAQDHTFTVGVGQWVVHNRCNPENLSNQNARRIAQRVLNAFNDHFKVSDLRGAWGDLHGNPVPDPAGGFYNHLLEVRNSLQSGRNAINAFVRLLNDPSLSEEDYCIIECLVGRISKTLDYVDKVINRDQWFEGANVLPFP